ncbi:MAG: DNA-binding protein WhiA [Ruminococcaceae bacterium]|jgi:DNA-binding protein WhiA|nr:DNA-binding protein WhiA [Oscillospiraceae bacterium]
MKHAAFSFSQRIKDELSQIPCIEQCCRQVELATVFFAAAKKSKTHIEVSTGHAGFAERLTGLVEKQYGITPPIRHGREFHTIVLNRAACFARIQADITTVFLSAERQRPAQWTDCCRRAFLRALYLSCGSVSEPEAAYHLELAVRRDSGAADLFKALLDQQDLRSTLVERQHYQVIYLREGQCLADYLLLAGAQHSYLTFELLRVEKEMRNSVNRVVNCDSANLQRVADTAARQSSLLRRLQEKNLDRQLPPDLKAAAETRLQYPELSLKELGAMMQPSLGKSGMNHRLKRFEAMAAELLSRTGE